MWVSGSFGKRGAMSKKKYIRYDMLGRKNRVRMDLFPRTYVSARRPLGNPFVLDKAIGSKYGMWFRNRIGVWHLYRFSQFNWQHPYATDTYTPSCPPRLHKAHVSACDKWYSDTYPLVRIGHPIAPPKKWKTAICLRCYNVWLLGLREEGLWEEVHELRKDARIRLRYLKAVAKKRRGNPPETPWYDQ